MAGQEKESNMLDIRFPWYYNKLSDDYALWTGKCKNLSKYKHTRSLSLDGQILANSMTYIYLKINRLQNIKH